MTSNGKQIGIMEEITLGQIHSAQCTLRNDMGNINELISSIREKGLLHPIVVRPVESSFEVIAGNRRFYACTHLGWKKILCHVIDLDDREAYEVSLIENIQHKTLDCIEEAEAFRRYVNEYGYGGVSDLARKIGKSPSYVSRRIALLQLPREYQEQVLRGRKNPGAAQELLSLDSEDMIRLSSSVAGKSLTRDHVRLIVRSLKENADDHLFRRDYSSKERRQHMMERTLTRCIASFKVCMIRIDEILDSVEEDDWMLREVLMHYRNATHQQIDKLLYLKKKLSRYDLL